MKTDFLNQVLGLIGGGASGFAAEKKGDEEHALKLAQIAATSSGKGLHIEKGADGQYYKVNLLTGGYEPLHPSDLPGFGAAAQPAAIAGTQQGAPVAPPVVQVPPQSPSGPPPVSASIPGIPPRMAAAVGGMQQAPTASSVPAPTGGGLHVPQPVPKQTTTAKDLRERIKELTTGGLPLSQALTQARREFGEPDVAPVVGSQEWKDAEKFKADLSRPHYENFLTPDGKTVYITQEEGARQGYIKAPSSGAGGSSGAGQNMQARLLGAVSEGRLADQRMTQFEKSHMKNGTLDVGALQDLGAGLNTGLAGSHGPMDIAIGHLAGSAMNATGNSDVLQYQRDARLISRAEQLMSARGGSEAMASGNAFLAAGGGYAPEATVTAARKSRQALFGKLGAVMQTLTPQQIDKLNAGLAALAQSDPGFKDKSPLEQTLDAVDHSGLANDIRTAALRERITKTEYSALRAQGFTDAQLRATYIIQP